jgi:hypothetical protein
LRGVRDTNFDSTDTRNPHASPCVMPIIDWYQGTFPSSTLPQVLNELASSLPGSTRAMIRPPKGMAYRHAFKLEEGVVVCYDNRYGHDTAAIIISGRAQPTQRLQLIARLRDLGVRATRIDVAFDDLQHHLSREKLEHAILQGHVVSHFHSAKVLQDFRLNAGSSSSCPANGWGVLFGSRQSDACVRMYDRGEHLRVELELKGDEAENFGDELVDIVKHNDVLALSADGDAVQTCDFVDSRANDAFKRLALQTLKAKLSFRDRSASSNVSRAPTEVWWENFLDYFDPVVEQAIPPEHRKSPEELAACFDAWIASNYDPGLFIPPYHPMEWEEMKAAEVRRNQVYGEVRVLLTELWETHKYRLARPESYLAPDRNAHRPHLRPLYLQQHVPNGCFKQSSVLDLSPTICLRG